MMAIRGAVQVDHDEPASIERAVSELCTAITEANGLAASEIISAIFTMTPDLVSAFPAATARKCGWGDVPMICAQEIPVPGALPRVCRVLLHVNRTTAPKHVYLGGARALRPDIAST